MLDPLITFCKIILPLGGFAVSISSRKQARVDRGRKKRVLRSRQAAAGATQRISTSYQRVLCRGPSWSSARPSLSTAGAAARRPPDSSSG